VKDLQENLTWKKHSIQDICTEKGLVRGPFGGSLKKEFFVKEGYKVYEQKNAIYRDASLGNYFIDEKKFNELKRFEVKEGDFIISCSGTIGKIYRIPSNAPKGIINQALLKIEIDKTKIDSEYFYQYFGWDHFQKRIIDNTQGGAMQNLVGMDQFRNTKLLIPPLKEQQKIASILSTWDKAIELKEKLIEQKKLQKKGLMQKLLTGEVRLPGFKGEWEIKKIKKLSKVYRGASPRPINDPKWFDQNSKIGWVRISDVTKSKKILYHTEQYLSKEGVRKSKLVEKDNIIMSICATVGKPIVTGFNVCIHDGFVVFEDLQLNKDYFYYALLKLENHWGKYGQKGSQMNLNTDIVGNEKIMYPKDKVEQEVIAEILINVDKVIELLEVELESIKQQKKGLMQLLLTGKVRVKV